MTYDPGSRGALTYLDAAREIAERGAAGEPVAEAGAEESGVSEREGSRVDQGATPTAWSASAAAEPAEERA
jgi:chromosome partitioning protein